MGKISSFQVVQEAHNRVGRGLDEVGGAGYVEVDDELWDLAILSSTRLDGFTICQKDLVVGDTEQRISEIDERASQNLLLVRIVDDTDVINLDWEAVQRRSISRGYWQTYIQGDDRIEHAVWSAG